MVSRPTESRLPAGSGFARLAVLAIVVLVLFWNSSAPSAKVARWLSIAYLVAAATLLAFGIGM